jgi:hypothetical protein
MREIRVTFPQPCDERWDAMQPKGCDRQCANCDTLVHNLEALTFDEAAALAGRGGEVCVRARIDAGGRIVLKRSSARGVGRMVLAAAASASALVSAVPALAQDKGKIVGKIDSTYWAPRVIATATDGKVHRAAVRDDGRFWIRNLPPGDYVVTATSCDGVWTVGTVTVKQRQVVMPPASEPVDERCIIVGMIQIEPVEG